MSQTGKASNGPAIGPQRLEDQLDAVTNRNSPFAGFASPITFRKGDPGVNRLIARDTVASGSVTVYDTVRVGVDVHFLHLEGGTPDGSSGYPFGTLPSFATFGEQSVDGLGAEVQASSDSFGGAIGMSPHDFLVQNWTGGLRLGSPDGSMRLVVARDTVKDSLLSFAGTRNPGTDTVWGGVVSNSVTVQFASSQSVTGQYVSVGGSLLRGEHVAENWGVSGDGGSLVARGVEQSGSAYGRRQFHGHALRQEPELLFARARWLFQPAALPAGSHPGLMARPPHRPPIRNLSQRRRSKH